MAIATLNGVKAMLSMHHLWSIQSKSCISLLYTLRHYRPAPNVTVTLTRQNLEPPFTVRKTIHYMVWPPYLACEFRRVADTESRQRLRSTSTAELIIPRVGRKTIGGRAFPVVAAKVWNSLPSSVTSSSSLKVFKSRLKTELLTRCYWVD